MRVGVYVDGFNLYKRGHALAGHAAGWKWLDIRGLAATLAADQWPLDQHQVSRVVYCTTRVKPTPSNPDGPLRQETFINALRGSGSVDWVEYGLFVDKVKTRPLAVPNRRGRPILVHPARPVLIKTLADVQVPDALFFVSVADREEKGSDVNVATHLLLDVLADPRDIDAAIVISNDSDLKVPVAEARKRIPVGVVNPGRGYTAGVLYHDPAACVPDQWERQLTFADYTAHQMPDPVGTYNTPAGW
jgi:hypothetical protein